MDEGMMGALLGLCVAAVAFLAWRIEKHGMNLKIQLIESASALEEKSFPDIPDFDELRESLEDLIAETIGSMRTPQLADHLGAMAQQFFQMKMAKQMQEMTSILPASDHIHAQEDDVN
jgi:hypothetical protein